MQIHEGTEAIREQEGDLLLTQVTYLTQAVSRLLERVSVLEKEVRTLRGQAIRGGAVGSEA